ncbi:uncharacterized protein LOC144770850 [Lissotriton helveticus]
MRSPSATVRCTEDAASLPAAPFCLVSSQLTFLRATLLFPVYLLLILQHAYCEGEATHWEEMDEQDSREARVTFRDVVALFNEEEWTHLHEWQKDLYKSVMMEVHQALLSLGYTIVNRDILLRTNREKEASFRDPPLPERESDVKEPTSYRHPAVVPDILLRIKHDEESYCRNFHDSLEAQIKSSYTSVVASCKTSEEDKNSVICQQTEKRECATPIGTAPILSTCSLNITPKGESHFQGSIESVDTGGLTSISVCSWIPKSQEESNCQKNVEQLTSACQPTNIPDVVVMIKAEEQSVCKKELKLEESGIHSVQTTGNGSINPNTKAEDFICSIEATEIFDTPSGFDNEWPHSTDNGVRQCCCTEHDQSLDQREICGNLQRTHTGVRPFQCPECTKSFAQKAGLIFHLRTHSGEKPYKCNQCGKSFSRKGVLRIHQRTHMIEKPFQCTMCNKSFDHRESLICHKNWHSRLMKHERRKKALGSFSHSNMRTFQCTECEQSFTRKGVLMNHQRTHMEVRPYQCSECNKSFAQKAVLINHLRIHSGERPYQCSQCSQSFSRKGILVNHQRTHTGEKPYQCSLCNKRFAQSGSLRTHETWHSRIKERETPKRTKIQTFPCTMCEKVFRLKGVLMNHLRTHMEVKPYQCNECDKSFAQKGSLIDHQRTHSGERPYKCTECDQSFSRKGILVSHQRTHTGERPYQCALCSKSFAQSGGLRSHERWHSKCIGLSNEPL